MTEVLRAHGHRVTRPRRAVWRALVDAEGHVTAEELAERVQRSESGVNLASVYRSLALFQDLDLVRESRLGDDDAARWELAHPDEHFHLICDACGRVEHHVGTFVEQVRRHLQGSHGFEAANVELIVSGRCADCRS